MDKDIINIWLKSFVYLNIFFKLYKLHPTSEFIWGSQYTEWIKFPNGSLPNNSHFNRNICLNRCEQVLMLRTIRMRPAG